MHRLKMTAIKDRAKKIEIRGATNTVAITPMGENEPKSDIEIGAPKIWAPVEAARDDDSFGGNSGEIRLWIIFENKRIPASAP